MSAEQKTPRTVRPREIGGELALLRPAVSLTSRLMTTDGSLEERQPGVYELNKAFLELLLIWAREVGFAATAAEFSLPAAAIGELAHYAADDTGKRLRALAREPFPYLAIDMAALPLGRGKGTGVGQGGAPASIGPDTERLRRLSIVQSMLITYLGKLSRVSASIPAVLFASNSVQRAACQDALVNSLAWHAVASRWIVATPLLTRRLEIVSWGHEHRYAAVTCVLQELVQA
jgi:hypothetical protein